MVDSCFPLVRLLAWVAAVAHMRAANDVGSCTRAKSKLQSVIFTCCARIEAMSMPTLFVSHGSPMLFLEKDLPARAFLATLGSLVPRPKAIVAVSAHWNTEQPAVSVTAKPETIHDFYGFPEALYQLRYDAPGAPELANRVAEFTGAVRAEYGLDHGAWVPALLGWPAADVPIFQLSVQPYMDPAHHIALGRKLDGLREQGILVMGSGSATHNLRRLVRGSAPDASPEPWARQFDDWVADTVEKGDEAALANYRSEAPHAREAHPTDEHFLPLHVAYGAAGKGARGKALHRTFTLGNLSMAAYAFD
jgi:4,5-DOPA dioxygenase extradiol